jgi:GGDEF domain-containing protein
MAAYAVVFSVFAFLPVTDIGLGHFFYLPVALVALVTSPLWGAAAGIVAAALYCIGVVVHPEVPSADVLTTGTLIRLITYSSTGVAIGWFASQNRQLVDELRVLAERDGVTGLPNTRAFEAAIERRLETGRPFALLIGDLLLNPSSAEEDHAIAASDALLRTGDLLGNTLAAGDDLARVGERAFAVLTDVRTGAEASRLARQVEKTLSGHALPSRLGWAVHPQDGDNALALYRAADERLYARKLVSVELRSAPSMRSVSA